MAKRDRRRWLPNSRWGNNMALPKDFSESGAMGAENEAGAAGSFGADNDSVGTAPNTVGAADARASSASFGGSRSDGGVMPPSYGSSDGANQMANSRYFAEGGAIPDGADDGGDASGNPMESSIQKSINDALTTVDNALSYGRQLHGLGGAQKQAA